MTSTVDLNGFKEIRDNPLSCVGVYPYLGKDIPSANEPSKIYQVYRPAEELADQDCINSFKLLPWVDEHTMLGGSHTPAEQKGVHGVVGEDVYFQDGYLRGNLKIFSGMLERLITSGKRELSCGYRCMYEKASGVFEGKPYDYIQRKIRGNHLALVDEGRMGPDVAVLDGLDLSYTFTIDSRGLSVMEPQEETKKTGEDEGGGSEMTLADVIAIVKQIGPQIAAINSAMASLTAPAPAEQETTLDADVDKDKDTKAMDSKIVALTKEIDDLKSNATKKLFGEITRRNNLYSQLSQHVGAFDHSEMDVTDIAKYGVKKLAIACDSGSEIAALTGYLHNRKPFSGVQVSVQDGKAKTSAVTAYLSKGGN